GCGLEFGVDPGPVSAPLRAAATRAMNEAAAFAETWPEGEPEATAIAEPILDPRFAPSRIQIPLRDRDDVLLSGDELQAWAQRDPDGARTFSMLDLFFRPIMALARFSDDARNAIQDDEALVAATVRLHQADPMMFLPFMGHSQSGQFLFDLLRAGQMPTFTGEIERQPPDGRGRSQVQMRVELDGIDPFSTTHDDIDRPPRSDPEDDGHSTAPPLDRIAARLLAGASDQGARIELTFGDAPSVASTPLSEADQAFVAKEAQAFVVRSKAQGRIIQRLSVAVQIDQTWSVSTSYASDEEGIPAARTADARVVEGFAARSETDPWVIEVAPAALAPLVQALGAGRTVVLKGRAGRAEIGAGERTHATLDEEGGLRITLDAEARAVAADLHTFGPDLPVPVGPVAVVPQEPDDPVVVAKMRGFQAVTLASKLPGGSNPKSEAGPGWAAMAELGARRFEAALAELLHVPGLDRDAVLAATSQPTLGKRVVAVLKLPGEYDMAAVAMLAAATEAEPALQRFFERAEERRRNPVRVALETAGILLGILGFMVACLVCVGLLLGR
ncbi:MAG: hypothetical protein AAF211_19500, partial [Myxococcota bacterium]